MSSNDKTNQSQTDREENQLNVQGRVFPKRSGKPGKRYFASVFTFYGHDKTCSISVITQAPGSALASGLTANTNN